MNNTRTDIHSPASFDPAAYVYAGSMYQGSSDDMLDAFNDPGSAELLDKIEAGNGGFQGNYYHKRSCDHCGARFSYGAIYQHTGGDLIVVGHICATEAFGQESRRAYDLKRLKDAVAYARETARGRAKAKAFIESVPGLADALAVDHYIIKDISGRLIRYGEISEKQVALVLKIAAEVTAPKTCDHCKAEGHEIDTCDKRVPLTAGRHAVEGVVLGTKVVETAYGSQIKMLFLLTTGSKVWCTVPSALLGTEAVKGKRVSMTVAIDPSRDDPFFGFGKRPSKAVLL